MMHSTDPKQCFHCIMAIGFTKSVFSRLTSVIRYNNFTQHLEYEVAVRSCYWSRLIFLYYFYSRKDTPQIFFAIVT